MLPALTAVLLAVAVAVAPRDLAAQDVPPVPDSAAVAADSEAAPADSAAAPAADDGGVFRTVSADTTDLPSGPSPMSAFFRSVLIPGWGQLAADQPVRGAFYFAMQSATVYMVIRTNNRIDEATGEDLKASRREQREDWLVLAGFWALASGIDAWVSAHMWSFEGEVVPPPDGSAGVAFRVSVPAPGF